jgi:DNA-binding FrmR family transcriptional regulator
MFEEDRSCLELAQQLHAVEKAIANAKEIMVQDHIEHCLDHALQDGASSPDVIKEFKEITKYL